VISRSAWGITFEYSRITLGWGIASLLEFGYWWGADPRSAAASQAAFSRICKPLDHYSVMKTTRRRLPHFEVSGRPLFVTFRLRGSLPVSRVFPASNLTSGQAFLTMDRLLDEACSGPTFLMSRPIAQLVQASLQYGEELEHYELHSWVIMPNHVHLLLTPRVSVSKLLARLKRSRRSEPTCSSNGQGNRSGRTRAMITWFAAETNSGASSATSKTTR
jgi:hypothetical protein